MANGFVEGFEVVMWIDNRISDRVYRRTETGAEAVSGMMKTFCKEFVGGTEEIDWKVEIKKRMIKFLN